MGTSEIDGVGKGYFTKEGRLKSKEELAQGDDTKETSTEKSSEVGKGFFHADGTLKTSSELAAEETSQSKNTTEQVSFSDDFQSGVSNAFGAIKGRVYEQANDLVYDLNEKKDLTKAALKNTKDQIAVAKDLKQAMKNGASDDEIQALQDDLAALQEEAATLKEKVDANNMETAPDRYQSIRVGNQELGRFEVAEIQYNPQSNEAPSSVEDVNKILDELKATKKDLKAQKSAYKEELAAVRDTAASALNQVDNLANNALQSVAEAQAAADEIANAVLSGSLEFVKAHTGLTPEIVQKFMGVEDE